MSHRYIHHRRPQETLLEPVGTLAELRLVPVGDVEDKALILCEETGLIYRYDYESVAADDGRDVIEPTAGVGAWLNTVVLTGLYTTESMFLSPSLFTPVDGLIWNLRADPVTNEQSLRKPTGIQDGMLVVDVPVEAGDAGGGILPLAFAVIYEVSTQALNDVTGTLLSVDAGADDAVGGALPTLTNMSVGQAFETAHDNAAKRSAINTHSTLHTLDSPTRLEDKQSLRLRIDIDPQANSVFDLYGVVLFYNKAII